MTAGHIQAQVSVYQPLDPLVDGHTNPTLYDILPASGAKQQNAGGGTSFTIGGAHFESMGAWCSWNTEASRVAITFSSCQHALKGRVLNHLTLQRSVSVIVALRAAKLILLSLTQVVYACRWDTRGCDRRPGSWHHRQGQQMDQGQNSKQRCR